MAESRREFDQFVQHMRIRMATIATIGIDLAKSAFSVHAVSDGGAVQMHCTVSRAKLLPLIAKLSPCLIGMEACSGSHEWARRFREMGHAVRLMAPKFVVAYRKGGKNDGNDAEAICEAVSRPNMRFVPIKTIDQQAVLTLHRIRQGFVTERTAIINRMRSLLAEFGIVVAQGANRARHDIAEHLDRLPILVSSSLQDLLDHLQGLDERVSQYDRQLSQLVRDDEVAQRLQSIPGVGPLTASAIVASVGNATEFRNGRQFAAWLGLVPRQNSTGGKARLGHITKSGDTYLRTLLVLGARAMLHRVARHQDRLSQWVAGVRERRGYARTTVALAAKNARILWALLTKGDRFVAVPA
jgi:transposase